MTARRQLLDAGEQLRTTHLFRDLSVAEAAILGTFMERRDYQPGDAVVRQGEVGDALYLIESGEAEVLAANQHIASLGVGDFFGEIALVTGGTVLRRRGKKPRGTRPPAPAGAPPAPGRAARGYTVSRDR